MTDREDSWKLVVAIFVTVSIGILIAARITGYWVLTALPVGFLFGFFLEKGDLCGSSAFSEALMMRNWKKIQGIWMIIVVSMLGFALLDSIGMVKLNPKPLLWAGYITGGIMFGIGMVLAGGCVSGSLFKTGRGNLNSMAALLGIPLGIMMVEHGPLNTFKKMISAYVIADGDGGPVTFASVFKVSYPILAVAFSLLTLITVIYFKRNRKIAETKKIDSQMPAFKRLMTQKWRPWQAGIAIGLLACMAYLSSAASGRNYPLGVTHGVMHAELLLTETNLTYVHAANSKLPAVEKIDQPQKKGKTVSVWLLLQISALVLGAFVSARLTGRAKLLPRPPGQTITAFFGGLLVGTGAAIAGGCLVGNVMSGVALMSVGNFLFAGVVILTNWVTTHFYLMGGSVKS
jgi:uncharacterized protein